MQTEPIKPKYDQFLRNFNAQLRDFYAQFRAIHIDELERKWITISMIVIGLFVGIITIDAFFHGVHPPSKVETVDSASLHLNKETLGRVPDKQAVRSIVMRLTEPYVEIPEAHIARAQAAQAVDDRMGALAAVDRALELRNGWEPAVLLKVQILQQAGAHAEALRVLEAEVARAPASRPLLLAKARALVSAQRFGETRNAFNQLLEASPQDPELLYAVGLLSLQLDEPGAAELHFARALAAGHPQPDLIRLHLGQIAADRGEGESARKWFGEIESEELRPEADIRSALSLAREERVDEARALP